MKNADRTAEQIMGVLHAHEAGAQCADCCRKHGMSAGTFHAGAATHSRMTVSEAKRLKALQVRGGSEIDLADQIPCEWNAKLTRRLAEQMRGTAAMPELLSKK
jgi:putative transposase